MIVLIFLLNLFTTQTVHSIFWNQKNVNGLFSKEFFEILNELDESNSTCSSRIKEFVHGLKANQEWAQRSKDLT